MHSTLPFKFLSRSYLNAECERELVWRVYQQLRTSGIFQNGRSQSGKAFNFEHFKLVQKEKGTLAHTAISTWRGEGQHVTRCHQNPVVWKQVNSKEGAYGKRTGTTWQGSWHRHKVALGFSESFLPCLCDYLSSDKVAKSKKMVGHFLWFELLPVTSQKVTKRSLTYLGHYLKLSPFVDYHI